jgi:hypothetical protein
MKRIILAILLSQAALADYAWAVDLSPYVGKDINEKVKGQSLLEVPDVQRNLINAFGSARYRAHRIMSVVCPKMP